MLCGSGIPVSDGARCFPRRNAALKYLRPPRPFSVLRTYTLKLIDVDAMSTGSVRGGVDDCVITIYAHKIPCCVFPCTFVVVQIIVCVLVHSLFWGCAQGLHRQSVAASTSECWVLRPL